MNGYPIKLNCLAKSNSRPTVTFHGRPILHRRQCFYARRSCRSAEQGNLSSPPFGEVPGRVYALKNDISDLEVVLRQVGHALEQHSLAPDKDQGQLQRILSRTKSHLADLGEALERVANACTGSKVKIISKSTIWWKEKARFHSFQEDIRSAKATLNLMLGAANS